jgi:type IV secretory pathway VirB10-like protein
MYSKPHTEVGAVVRSRRWTSSAVLACGLVAAQFGVAHVQVHAHSGEPAIQIADSAVNASARASRVATNPDKKTAAELKAARAEKAEKKKAERAAKREEKLAKRASAKKGSGSSAGSKPASDDSMGGSDDPLEGL